MVYCRATPRFGEQAPPPALAEGWLVPNWITPLPEASVEPTCFSPEASVMNQPTLADSFSALVVFSEAEGVVPEPATPASSGAVPLHEAGFSMHCVLTSSNALTERPFDVIVVVCVIVGWFRIDGAA